MKLSERFTMSTINATLVATICAAAIGKRLTLESLREFALCNGLEAFLQLQEAGRVWFATEFAHKVLPGRDSLAYMQKDKVPGVSTFYTYTQAIRRCLEKGDIEGLTSMTVGGLTNKGSKKAGGAKTGGNNKTEQTPGLAIADAIAFLQMAHMSGALTAADYVALASIKAPALQPAPMADIIEATPLLAAA
jgi:hypothetical protein